MRLCTIQASSLLKKKQLPYDAEVEWLGSNGNDASIYGLGPYILSQYDIVAGNIFEADVSFSETLANSEKVLGRNSGNYECFITWYGDGYFGGSRFTQVASFATGQLYKVRFDLTVGAMSLTVNGIEYKTSMATQPNRDKFPLFVVAYNAQNILNRNVKIRIHRFRTWNGGELVEDFNPVRVGSEGAMYDKVSGQLFGNSGTGDFTLGPDVTSSGGGSLSN